MIVNTEFEKFPNGNNVGVMYISYVKEDGTIDVMSVPIPQSEMYCWKYANRKQDAFPGILSWDFLPVRKEAVKTLNDYRMREIMYALDQQYGELMKPLYMMNMPKTAFTDIEVDVIDDFPTAESAMNMVNTISWVEDTNVTVLGRANLSAAQVERIQNMIDDYCKRFDDKYDFTYVYHQSEADLLADYMCNYVAKVPCVTGWNFFGYDWPYLYNRCVNKLNFDLSFLSPTKRFHTHKPFTANKPEDKIEIPYHKMMYDYMEIYMKWDRSIDPKESNKLDWVSEKVLGVKKVEHALGFKEFWEQQPMEYVFYNAIDSILVREDDKVLKTSSAFFGLANETRVPALTVFSPVNTLQLVQTEYLMRDNRVVPVDSHKFPNDEGYEGAFVFEPIPGVYTNVFATDFRSLYPSTEMQFNISPDTFICKDPDIKNRPFNPNEITTTSGAVYRRDIKGFIPTITEDFFNKRRMYKKDMLVAESELHELEDIYERRFGDGK